MAQQEQPMLTIAARLDELARCRRFIEEQGKALEIPQRAIWQLVVACDEICANVIRHGYRDNPNGTISISMYCEGGYCTVEMRDTAPPHDPVRPNRDMHPTLTKSGHGLILANRMAQISYTPKSDDADDNVTSIRVPIR